MQKPDFSNKAYLFPHINAEGWKFGAVALVIALAVVVASIWVPGLQCLATLLVLLAYGVFLFFRDPERYPPENEPGAILSPADGRICLIQECEFPDELGEMPEYKGKKFWRVSVFMSVFNVHVNRMPTAGKILKKQYVAAGKFFNASLDKASKENERCNYLIGVESGKLKGESGAKNSQSSTPNAKQIVYAVTQIAGLVARRIVPQVNEGDVKERAERFGLIRFGSRLDVYLPEGVKPAVGLGQIMVAGETVLGRVEG